MQLVDVRSGSSRRIAAVITLIAITAILPFTPAHAQALDSTATLTVNAGKIETSPFTRYLSINGTVNAWQEVIIAPEVGGYRVEDVLVDVGDYVQAGQELVRLSTSILQTELKAREAALKQREAQAENARLAYERAQTIAKRDLLSAADLDRLNSETLTAAAAVEAAKAELEAARVRLNFAKVTAPDSGLITARNVTVGQLAQAGGEMLRLLRQNRVEWRGEVPEASLPSLAVGQRVTITSVDGREHEGSVRVVSPTVDPVTHNGLVYVDVEADTALRPGMFARGRIEFDQSEALMVPLNALVSSDGYNYVFIIQSDRTVRRQMIQTGTIQGDDIEVLGGLEPGANIVTSGAGFLKDGDLVNVVQTSVQTRAP
ncbi:MAG: efflux RND transporter periplasmic adaptor subunit [Gammaproteobacteria bacterium]